MAWFCVREAASPPHKNIESMRIQWNQSARSRRCLRLPYCDSALCEINLRPTQVQYFTVSHRRVEGKCHSGIAGRINAKCRVQ